MPVYRTRVPGAAAEFCGSSSSEAHGETPLIRFADNGLLEGLMCRRQDRLMYVGEGILRVACRRGRGRPSSSAGKFASGKLDLATGIRPQAHCHGNPRQRLRRDRGHIEKESKGDRAVWLVFELPSLAEGLEDRRQHGQPLRVLGRILQEAGIVRSLTLRETTSSR